MPATMREQLDADSRADYDRRRANGEQILTTAWGSVPCDDDRASAATDAIANVLTAMFGPAGCYAVGGSYVGSESTQALARELACAGVESWLGDAEDYTREPEPGEYGHEEVS